MEDEKVILEREESDHIPSSYDRKMDRWLVYNHIFWIIVGFVGFALFWNGSFGWFDRGYWRELQQAANTTFPFVNANQPGVLEDLNKHAGTQKKF